MRAFHCDRCGSLVFFENVQCVRCNQALGFIPEAIDLSTLDAAEGNQWRALLPAARNQLYKTCRNAQQHQVCNWLVPASDANPFCRACRLNEMIPDLEMPGNRERWQKLEVAKRRVLYTLLRLAVQIEGARNRAPLRFRFMSDVAGQPPVMTGHNGGVITLNIAEADDEERERRRVSLGEPFRTLLGHLRHEVAHYYWNQLINDSPFLDRFRKLFGDERQDYAAALQAYYENGPSADWQTRHVTAYANAHPWEDWAETSAHYLHIVDSVETAASFGVTLRPRHPDAKAMTSDPKKVDDTDSSFDRILGHWLPLTYALNELNRGMGLPDLYPFVLSPPAIEKLRFAHEVFAHPAT